MLLKRAAAGAAAGSGRCRGGQRPAPQRQRPVPGRAGMRTSQA